MTDSTKDDELIEGAVFAIAEGIPNYDAYAYIANNSIEFEGKCVTEWTNELSINPPKDDMSIEELSAYNHDYLEVSEKIMTNLAKARFNYGWSNIHYRKELARKRHIVLERINSFNANTANSKKKRIPGKEALDDQAKGMASEVWTAYKLAQMWKDFFEDQYDKMKLASFRLTSLNTAKNVVSKIG